MTAHQKWQRIERVRGKILKAERAAILAALEESGWLVARAARLLRPDTPSHAWLAAMLRVGGRHADIGEQARKRSAADGYIGGRPTKNYNKERS